MEHVLKRLEDTVAPCEFGMMRLVVHFKGAHLVGTFSDISFSKQIVWW